MVDKARYWLDAIHEIKPESNIFRIMNVCGGHERSISKAGLRSVLPDTIELIPGPGCPVCVCPEEDIYQAIQLALHENVILVAFGDMLREFTSKFIDSSPNTTYSAKCKTGQKGLKRVNSSLL